MGSVRIYFRLGRSGHNKYFKASQQYNNYHYNIIETMVSILMCLAVQSEIDLGMHT